MRCVREVQGLRVGPFFKQGLVETFDFTVGFEDDKAEGDYNLMLTRSAG